MPKTYPDSTIVDDDDQVIGQMQLPEAMEKGIKLRVGRVMVENSKGEILLQQRGKHVLSPLKWNDAAAGHVAGADRPVNASAPVPPITLSMLSKLVCRSCDSILTRPAILSRYHLVIWVIW